MKMNKDVTKSKFATSRTFIYYFYFILSLRYISPRVLTVPQHIGNSLCSCLTNQCKSNKVRPPSLPPPPPPTKKQKNKTNKQQQQNKNNNNNVCLLLFDNSYLFAANPKVFSNIWESLFSVILLPIHFI